jgi:hypothetical protein
MVSKASFRHRAIVPGARSIRRGQPVRIVAYPAFGAVPDGVAGLLPARPTTLNKKLCRTGLALEECDQDAQLKDVITPN